MPPRKPSLCPADLLSLPPLLAAAPFAEAQAQEALHIPLLTGPIQLAGFSDEPAWQQVAPLSLVMHQPTFGEAPTERTEVRVAHDGQFLYVAARM